MNEKFPILIPAYNAESTIGETLASILHQSPLGLAALAKVILADDGSTDDTCAMAERNWQPDAPTLEIWRADRNRGERSTVNAAFQRLLDEGYRWCFVLHADDIAKPHWLECLVPLLTDGAQPRVSVCSSWDNWYPGVRTDDGQDDPNAPPGIIPGTHAAAAGTLRAGCWWHFSGCAMQLQHFFNVGPFRPDMPQLGDLEWLLRCGFTGKEIAYLPRTLIRYRCHASNVSSTSFATNRDIRESLQIYDLYNADPRLSAACHEFLKWQLRTVLRRVAVAAVRLQPSRFRSASTMTARIVKNLLRRTVSPQAAL